MNVTQIPFTGILAPGEKLTTDVSTGACESETGCTAASDDWLDGCQQNHKITRRGSRGSHGNGSGKGKKGGRDSKNAAQKGIVRSGHSKLPRATQPLLNEVRINTAIGTQVGNEGRYRERVREVTRIEEASETQDTLSFLRGRITVAEGDHTARVMVDGGSDIEAVSWEIVKALGLLEKMVARKPEDRQRVRGVGTAEGQGEVITHDVWTSIAVPGKRLTGWGQDMTPLEGEVADMVIEEWWAVIKGRGCQ
jgi:hypothetical protein